MDITVYGTVIIGKGSGLAADIFQRLSSSLALSSSSTFMDWNMVSTTIDLEFVYQMAEVIVTAKARIAQRISIILYLNFIYIFSFL